MNRRNTIIALSGGLIAGYLFAAAPNYAALKSSNADKVAVEPDAQILAQASSSQSSAQEQQLLNQIDTDVGKLKADEAAEQGQQKPINPDVKWLRATAYHLAEAAHTL